MSKHVRKFGLFDKKTETFAKPFYDTALAAIAMRDFVRGVDPANDHEVVLVLLNADDSVEQFYRSENLISKERFLVSEKMSALLVTGCLKGNPLMEGAVEQAYKLGLIAKKDLVDGKYYYGHCRNARVARWDANGKPRVGVEEGPTGRFVHIRHKFGSSFPESINHPEDDNGYDFFVPVAEIEPLEAERVDDESLRTTG